MIGPMPSTEHESGVRVTAHCVAALLALCATASACAHAASLDGMLEFDAVYIPALSWTTNGARDSASADRARATMQRLRAQWHDLRRNLGAVWPHASSWQRALDDVQRRLARADAAVARQDWSGAHQALEEVRVLLKRERELRSMDYYVDRLTAFHEPMEAFALAAATLQPAQIDEARQRGFEQTYARARALWHAVERMPLQPNALRLSPARERQLRQGLADEGEALAKLSDALRGASATALLQAAAALKPPFARSFTAFGLSDDETQLPPRPRIHEGGP
jgi:hypothetical protein